MCVIGFYTSNSNIFDVWVIIRFGVSGCCLSNNKLRKSISAETVAYKECRLGIEKDGYHRQQE
jgi:hypothetical protein